MNNVKMLLRTGCEGWYVSQLNAQPAATVLMIIETQWRAVS